LQERTGRLGWDELRTVLEVARAGSLSGAARALDVEHSTVFRRIDEIERRIGLPLFERTRSGYHTNADGEAVADAARLMEEAAFAAERRVHGAHSKLEGSIRVATSEVLACHGLLPVLKGFAAAHPLIEVEIAVTNKSVDLTRREADLAIRGTNTPPEHLVGRPIGEVRYAAFGSARFARGNTRPDLATLPWLGYDDSLADLAPARWMRQALPAVQPILRSDSLMTLLRACAGGLGVAVLPTFAAAQHGELRRLSDVIDQPRTTLWLLSHPDVRHNARVRAFSEYMAREIPAALTAQCMKAKTCPKLARAPAARPRRHVAMVDQA
jgi:DNA-binding transcriptional LysR family regulator